MNRIFPTRTRILAIVFSCFMLFSLLLSGISLYRSYLLIKSESEEKLMNLMRVHARTLDAEIVQREVSINVIDRYIRQTLDLERFLQEDEYILEYKKKMEPLIFSIAQQNRNAWFFFDPEIRKWGNDIWYAEDSQGNIRRMPEEDLSAYNDLNEALWFCSARDKRECLWTNPYPSLAFEDVFWVTYSCSVYIEGKFIGVGGHDFYFNELRESLENISIYGTGFAFLLNEDFEFLVHPDMDSVINLKAFDSESYESTVRFIKEHETGILEYRDEKGEARTMAFSHLSNNWIIGTTAASYIIYRPLFIQIRSKALIILGGLISFYLLLHGLTLHMTMNLENLTHTLSHIKSGDYASPIPAGLTDDRTEVGVLARTVENMRILQNRSIKEIRRYNAELEKVVERRTDDLERSRGELELSLELLKSTQKKVVESKKFEATNRFLMEIAHRLNTPLGNVRMAVTFIESVLKDWGSFRKTGEGNPAAYIAYLKDSSAIASSGILNSLSIIRNLQDITGDFEKKDAESVNLYELLQDGIREFCSQYDITDSGAIQLECRKNLVIHTYPVRIKRMFHNLLSYSMKYSMKESEVFKINLTVCVQDDLLLLEFRDNSRLSYMELKERIFEPYSVNSFQDDGGGMEMHMIYSLVKIGLDGDIECLESNNRPYFRISLPVQIV